jgi:hypothetical protein
MRKWFWSRAQKRAQGVTAVCLMASDDLVAAPGHAPDWVGPEEPLSSLNPLGNYLCQLFREAQQRQAATLELALDRESGSIRVQSEGSGGWQPIPGPPESMWSGLVFACLRSCVIESCQGTIQDPASGEAWHFAFRKGDDQIRLRRVDKGMR